MAVGGSSVVVHDVDSLEKFGMFLQSRKDELETLYELLDEETYQQGDNWQDPQYLYLKEQVSAYCSACKTQLDELEESITYISNLVEKLRDL